MPRSSPSQKAQKKLMKLTKLAQRKAHQSKLNVDGDAELLVELARSAKIIKAQLKKKLKMKNRKKPLPTPRKVLPPTKTTTP